MSWYYYAAAFAYKTYQGMSGTQAAMQQSDEQTREGYAVANANEERVRRRDAQQLGSQRAAAAETGFDPNSGSLATLQAQSSGNLELDALTARYAGAVNAWRNQQVKNNAQAQKWTGGLNAFFGGANAAGSYYGGPTLNSGNSYYGADGQRYANNDLSGTSRGSGD